MRIEKPTLRIADGRTYVETPIRSDGLPDRLWYSVPERFQGLLAASSDAQLVALLIPAMARGEDITVAGRLSEKLYYHLPAFQRLLLEVMPFLKAVKVHAAELGAESSGARGVATGFSGGIDSFCVLADHHYGSGVPEGFRITHLLCNNVGSHDSGGQAVFRRRYERLLPLAERLGLPYLDVDSNVDDFHGGRLDFQQTHGPRNTSVALLLGGGIGRFMYASAHRYRDVAVVPWNDTALTDLIWLPMLSTESTACFSVGSEYSRVEKTVRVAALPDSRDYLDVCTKAWSPINCGTCPKCKRTLLTLEIAGRLQDYERVFDLAAWRKVRSGYIGRVFHDDDPFTREIVEFARQAGLRRSTYSRLYGAAWKAKESVMRMARIAAPAPREHVP